MDITDQASEGRPSNRLSQTEQRSLQRLEHIATKGLHDPDALSRVEILELCKLVFCRLAKLENNSEETEAERRRAAAEEMVRVSQELGLE